MHSNSYYIRKIHFNDKWDPKVKNASWNTIRNYVFNSKFMQFTLSVAEYIDQECCDKEQQKLDRGIIIIIIIIKTRYDCVGKVIHWELCRRLQFYYTTKWYMNKPKSVLQNEMHKILWDFKIQTDHLILARRPDLVLIYKKKKNLPFSGFCYFDGP